jgi:hypothetical protein
MVNGATNSSKAVSGGGSVDICPDTAPLGGDSPVLDVDCYFTHLGQVNHNPAGRGGSSAAGMAPAADGKVDAVAFGEQQRGGDIIGGFSKDNCALSCQ